MPNPKLFISYSWSSPDHEKWVLELAEELVGAGIEVVLDKWDLKPGHDANVFMEGMVTDPSVTKVLLICDQKYAEKSNVREGGAGTEAQIISPELYKSAKQDKFVAIIRERDSEGKPFIPVYYGGRIFIDLSNDLTYAKEYETLLRWLWDKPLYEKPEIGAKPAFLNEDGSVKLRTTVTFRRAMDAIKSGREVVIPFVKEYFDQFATELERFRISYSGDEFDEDVVRSINDFLPYRNEFLEVVSALAIYRLQDDFLQLIQRFFERLLPYLENKPDMQSWHEVDFDNYRFIIHEMFLYLVAILVKNERFDAASFFLDSEYFLENRHTGESMRPFTKFGAHVRSLEYRNQRRQLNRLSVHADLLGQRNQASGIEFQYLMTADFVLFLRSLRLDSNRWWPHTLVFATYRAPTFEMFARAKSSAYFKKIKKLIGIKSKDDLDQWLGTIERDPRGIPRWHFDSLDLRALSKLDTLDTQP
ncbi:MAG: SEFIR domain-containing protein [Pseudomonadota bacterium]